MAEKVSPSEKSSWYNPVRSTTVRRHQIVLDKFNELSKLRVKGMRLRIDDIILEVAKCTGYAAGTVENIINRRT